MIKLYCSGVFSTNILQQRFEFLFNKTAPGGVWRAIAPLFLWATLWGFPETKTQKRKHKRPKDIKRFVLYIYIYLIKILSSVSEGLRCVFTWTLIIRTLDVNYLSINPSNPLLLFGKRKKNVLFVYKLKRKKTTKPIEEELILCFPVFNCRFLRFCLVVVTKRHLFISRRKNKEWLRCALLRDHEEAAAL